jgi:tetratricopeptide (TPR) repeat protein
MSSIAQSSPVPSSRGEIITFYSYKGGTGRSMAVANVACLLSKRLARTSQRVLVMDWDLEAPGLHRFFSAKSELPEYDRVPGVINYFDELRNFFTKEPGFYKKAIGPEGWRTLDDHFPLEKYCIPDVVQGVDFMRAGLFGPDYAKLVGSFSWIQFFHEYGGVIKVFRELLARKFAYTLVDSRTGLTDVSGICTSLLPEKLIGVFTPNQQSLYGLRDLVIEALEYRRRSADDFRPLSVFPLPSRIDLGEKDLREKWGKEYQEVFEALFRSALEIGECDLTKYFNDVLLPQIGYFAYGEKIAILQERPDAISLSAAYQRFFDRLMNTSYAWEVPGEETEAPPPMAAQASAGEIEYDAFLSYPPSGAPDVAQVDMLLQRFGVKTFFPARDLAPGQQLVASTAAAMAQSKAVVVFVGPGGAGPWNDQELAAILENCAKDSTKRIIPVLLPRAPKVGEMRPPNYLSHVNWVDLRSGVKKSEGMGNSVWALTGVRPKTSRLRTWVTAAVVGLAVVVGAFYGVRYLYERGYVGAIADARKQVQQKPNDANAHEALGDALRHWGRNDEAVQEYLAALRLAPDGKIPSLGIYMACSVLGPSRCLPVYKQAVTLVPTSAYLHSDLSDELNITGDVSGAISEAREAVRLEPQNISFHSSLAALLEKNGNLEGALLEYFAERKLAPPPASWSILVPDPAEAIKRLSEKLNLKPLAWGVMLSADKQLAPEKSGDPSATYEIELAQDNDLPNLALYQRPNWYGTVTQFQDQASAAYALAGIKTAAKGRWRGAVLIPIENWCAKVELSDLIQVDNHYVPIYTCPALSPLAKTALSPLAKKTAASTGAKKAK